MDLNGDGHIDLLSGSWPGELFFFRGGHGRTFSPPEMLKDKDGKIINIGGGIQDYGGSIVITGHGEFETTPEGTFVNYHGRRLESTPEKPISITGTASAAHATDWDGDGDFDILVGDIRGYLYLLPNEGTRKLYSFGKEMHLRSGGQPLRVEGDAGPFAADWDGDGDLDLLVGAGDGSVSLYRNSGSAGDPKLSEAELLVPPGDADLGENPPREPRRGVRSKVCAADWDGDGKLDLLVGDFTIQKPDLPEPTPEEKAAQDRARKELVPIKERYRELKKAYGPSRARSKEEREKIEKEMEELSERIQGLQAKIPPEYENHGWVWLFLRKSVEAKADESVASPTTATAKGKQQSKLEDRDPREVEKDFPNAGPVPEKGRDGPIRIAEEFAANIAAGKLKEAAELCWQERYNAEKLKKLAEVVGKGPWTIETVDANDKVALAITSEIEVKADPGGKSRFSIWMRKRDGIWRVRDIDFEPGERAKERRASFLEDFPDASPEKPTGEFIDLFSLADGEVLKCVLPPFPPDRLAYYRRINESQAKAIPEGPNAMLFRWRKGKPVNWGMSFGGPDLPTLLRILMDIFPQEIEGDPRLLKTTIPGDWVVREGAPAEKVVAGLEEILRRDHKLPLRLSLREEERKVIVARGRYRHTPIPGRPPQIEIYSRELSDPSGGGGGSGGFSDFLNWAGMYIHRRVVSEVEEPPQGDLHWHYNESLSGKQKEGEEYKAGVLRHLSEQTALTFSEEKRRVRVLVVERAD